VSEVEQVLTTGGGWQDQVGAIFGGFKIGRSLRGLPLTVEVNTIANLPVQFIHALEQRLVVVYSGQQRLAKDTLIKALRKYSVSQSSGTATVSLFTTVSSLVAGAEEGFAMLKKVEQETERLDNSQYIHSVVDDMASVLNR
jgi:galactokinase/mevalonate kinase-like predicted kinase